MKNILVARDRNQAQEITKFLDNKGCNAFVEPLFAVEKLQVKLPQADVVIITSANACAALIDSDLPKNVLVFAVGRKTASILKNSGFVNVKYPKTSSALALQDLISYYAIDKSKKIIYLHGPIISQDFFAEKILVYKIHEFANFSEELLEFVKKNKFDEIFLFSQNSAEIFFRLARKHNLLEYFKDSSIVAINKKILLKAEKLGFRKLATFLESSILQEFYE